MKKTILFTLSLLLFLSGTQAATTITDLKCENLTNPNAINNVTPLFSWKIITDKVGAKQTYYEIQIASDSITLINGKADLWKPGKVKSPASVMIKYKGKSLASRSLCYWRVRIWDEKGKASEWSKTARFGIGILNNTMQGQYIGLPAEAGNTGSPLLRTSFNIDKKNTSFFHVNSLGYHEVYINGQKVSNDVLSPAVSQLDKRSLIVTYEITHYIKEGVNDLILWLGKGWYKKTTFGAAYDRPLVKVQLDILRNNEWNTLLTTGSSWQGAPTGYTDTGTWQALQFGGERVNMEFIPENMEKSTLDNLKWHPVEIVAVPEHLSTPEMSEPNRIQEIFSPVNIIQLENATWLVDIGKNINGWFEMHMSALSTGHEIKMEYTDYIDKDGKFHDQGQRDSYISAGRNNEVFRNKFNHHAFRYVKIHNLPTKPRKEDIKAYLIHTDYKATSSFRCSDPDLNAIHDMIQYTMRCLAFGGYMVDCPHLERAGYGGDGNSSTETIQTMYDVAPLYTNWIETWGDAMREGGSLPHVGPNPGAGGGGPYWCGFIVMAPWQTYLNYGDTRLIEKYYPYMKEWMKYVEKYTVDGLLKRWPDTKYRDWFLGDWLAPIGVDSGNELSINLVNNCFISDCLATMEKIAVILDKPDEAKDYAIRRDNLNQLLHKTFYKPEERMYSTGSQLDMTYPMLTGVTPPDIYPQVRDQMIALTNKNHNDHIAVGLVGVPILTKWAIQNKEVDFMYKMLKKRDYPGYLYMIDNNATTTWEYWNGERSRIHNCYNGIGMWFYQAIGGLRTDEKNTGYKHIYIEPQIPEGVTWSRTTKESPYGTIGIDWELKNGYLIINTVIPPGCTASVVLPENTKAYRLDNKAGLMNSKTVNIESGRHNIDIQLN